MELLYLVIIGLIIAVILIAVNASKHDFSGTIFEESQRKVGRRGEERAASVIRSVLREGDCLFTNVNILIITVLMFGLKDTLY